MTDLLPGLSLLSEYAYDSSDAEAEALVPPCARVGGEGGVRVVRQRERLQERIQVGLLGAATGEQSTSKRVSVSIRRTKSS